MKINGIFIPTFKNQKVKKNSNYFSGESLPDFCYIKEIQFARQDKSECRCIRSLLWGTLYRKNQAWF